MESMVTRLHAAFGTDSVNVDEVNIILNDYKSEPRHWQQYAFFDQHRYTRNLVDAGNGRFNLMILCWGPAMGSSIHDHTNSHCFVKMLQGELLESLYDWPKADAERRPLVPRRQTRYYENGVTYINDEIGLHRMENPSHTETAVSLHLYVPPFDHCRSFNQATGACNNVRVTFWSECGERKPLGVVATT